MKIAGRFAGVLGMVMAVSGCMAPQPGEVIDLGASKVELQGQLKLVNQSRIRVSIPNRQKIERVRLIEGNGASVLDLNLGVELGSIVVQVNGLTARALAASGSAGVQSDAQVGADHLTLVARQIDSQVESKPTGTAGQCVNQVLSTYELTLSQEENLARFQVTSREEIPSMSASDCRTN